jgi:hypothetical protein
MLSSSTEWCAASLEEQELRKSLLWTGFIIAWVLGVCAKGRWCLKSKMADSPGFDLWIILE